MMNCVIRRSMALRSTFLRYPSSPSWIAFPAARYCVDGQQYDAVRHVESQSIKIQFLICRFHGQRPTCENSINALQFILRSIIIHVSPIGSKPTAIRIRFTFAGQAQSLSLAHQSGWPLCLLPLAFPNDEFRSRRDFYGILRLCSVRHHPYCQCLDAGTPFTLIIRFYGVTCLQAISYFNHYKSDGYVIKGVVGHSIGVLEFKVTEL